MARTQGAKNRSPRELKSDGKHLIEKGKLKEKIETLKKKP